MVGGFLGTLITFEKIIPLKKPLLYVIPLVSATSVLLFFLKIPTYPIICLLLASGGLSIVFLIYWLQERSLIYAMMFAGAVCWLIGNLFLLQTNFYPTSIPWWMAFTLLIICSERLELMKFLPVTKSQKWQFIASLMAFLIACAMSFHGAGNYVAALAITIAAIWLMRHDVVGINIKKTGLNRYVGAALLSGYFALMLSGLCFPLLIHRALGYDALVHSFFIGFVFSMIFAHGPIILPGVLGISLKPYHPILYFWLAMLHASWILRMVSDLVLDMPLRKYSGLSSVVAIVGYLLSMASITIKSQRAQTA